MLVNFYNSDRVYECYNYNIESFSLQIMIYMKRIAKKKKESPTRYRRNVCNSLEIIILSLDGIDGYDSEFVYMYKWH